MRIEISRDRGGRLVIQDAEKLAVAFFQNDVASVGPTSYDECARTTKPREPFREHDITPIQTGMRLRRLKSATWDWLLHESPRDFLTECDPSWDLAELEGDTWNSAREVILAALDDFIGANRGPAVATKFLHFKRCRLFPILDSVVVDMTGLRIPALTSSRDPDTIERNRRARVQATLVACERLREHALANLEGLRHIQGILAAQDIDRPVARILDALLWSVHPATDPSHTGVIRWSLD
jgi:hypothetical protein